MNARKKKRTIYLIAAALALALLLPACRGIAFSPEAAASAAIMGNIETNVALIDDSLAVRHSEKVNDNLAVVVLTYQQLRNRSDVENCLFSYEVQKRSVGWFMKSGGGGCWPLAAEAQEGQEIQIGTGQSHSSDPGDVGFTTAYGMVRDPEIVKVEVTWNDDTLAEMDVTDSSFVAYRFGLFELAKVEGLSAQGDVLYTYTPQVAPGKLP